LSWVSHSDDGLVSGVALLDVPDSVRDLAQRVDPVDDRHELPGLEKFPENRQVRGVLLSSQDSQLLAHDRGERNRAELGVEAPQPPPVGLAADDDEPSAGGEGSTEVRQPIAATDIEDGVVALLAVGEVVARVVDVVVGPMARTRSILAVLHTPVTLAPKALAI